jgi:hypothetical protein
MKGVAHYGVEVAAMDVMQIPATLPPAITVSREVAQLCLADDLVAYGAAGPAALAWRWALTGEGPNSGVPASVAPGAAGSRHAA